MTGNASTRRVKTEMIQIQYVEDSDDASKIGVMTGCAAISRTETKTLLPGRDIRYDCNVVRLLDVTKTTTKLQTVYEVLVTSAT